MIQYVVDSAALNLDEITMKNLRKELIEFCDANNLFGDEHNRNGIIDSYLKVYKNSINSSPSESQNVVDNEVAKEEFNLCYQHDIKDKQKCIKQCGDCYEFELKSD